MEGELVFHILFWVLIVILLGIRGYFAWRVRQTGGRLMPDQAAVQREGKIMFASRVVLFSALVGWLIAYAFNPVWVQALDFPLPAWLRWVGFILGLAGLALLAWTEAVLGRHWSAQLQLRQEHHLVTSGPYARVRHPLYASMVVFGVGFALLTANWIFAALAALIIIGLFARMPREEQMMLEQFGDEYRAYMHKTGRLFPK
jgi:protein-S-isoprenylcysteine O-methyltransferase Ste14